MKLSFAAALLCAFTLATFDDTYGEAADPEIPKEDLESNATSWSGPQLIYPSGVSYTAGGKTSWKRTSEGDETELIIYTTTTVTAAGNDGIGEDNVMLMTCIPELADGPSLTCIV